jgi:hypothetical protein
MSLNFNSPDALNAECALLYQTSRANGHIWVELLVQWSGELRSQPIVGARFVRAGAAAVARTDAAVVDLGVQAFRSVVSGKHRTNWFTRSLTALLAHYRHKTCFYIWVFTFPISLNMDPM